MYKYVCKNIYPKILDKDEIRKQLEEYKEIDGNGNWLWPFSVNTGGYGQLRVNGKLYLVSRLSAWVYKNFNLDSELNILHKCDIRRCYNPDCLFIGTFKDNAVDAISKHRHFQANKTHCKQGHEYTPENTYRHSRGRSCRICHRISDDLYQARKKLNLAV